MLQVFDLMGFSPCHHNKINIHVGGIYGDKEHTIRRFAENFNTKCSPNLQARMTVENDDRPNSYSMTDLLLLHNLTSIPLVSDKLLICMLCCYLSGWMHYYCAASLREGFNRELSWEA